MSKVKSIKVKPITARLAREFVKKHHYSGKFVSNSSLHLGCYLNGFLGGVMQFGPSMDKRKVIGLVKGTSWNGFLELNRMAFSDILPRNSESRCIAIAMRLIRKNYPHIKWIISFADGTQCGDGTIYRASGFSLIGIKENSSLIKFPSGDVIAAMTFESNSNAAEIRVQSKHMGIDNRYRTRTEWIKLGAEKLKGYQLKYIYFIDKTIKKDLTVDILPFSKIKDMGAEMYKGVSGVNSSTASDQLDRGGAVPTDTLQTKKECIDFEK